jgi:transposase
MVHTIVAIDAASCSPNGHTRAVIIEAAWLWIKYQRKSALTQWFTERTEGQSRRVRKILIVAVVRKLAIALWRYDRLVPQGAMLSVSITSKAKQ